ncbi:MAG: hypothetical protein R2695_19755 [Acidimicrobiales bacterium]
MHLADTAHLPRRRRTHHYAAGWERRGSPSAGVADLEATRAALVDRGVAVTEPGLDRGRTTSSCSIPSTRIELWSRHRPG